jgi:hypothetical protein
MLQMISLSEYKLLGCPGVDYVDTEVIRSLSSPKASGNLEYHT